MAAPSLASFRAFAAARTFFPPEGLLGAIERLGFVQADPIRSPARAQDLILRHRVQGYRAGDLERRYPDLPLEEDHFVNYGFLPREVAALMHPRTARRVWDRTTRARARAVRGFVAARGEAHPRDVEAAFDHGRVENYWGGSSNATTHLLEGMHYRGMVRVARREGGVRVYSAHDHAAGDASATGRAERARALLDLAVRKYAPVPLRSLPTLARMVAHGAPQLRGELRTALADAKARAAERGGFAWPDDERPGDYAPDDAVRLLAPFDPVVWDRARFEAFWGWDYRFEAYTPAAKRRFGYYALPVLFRDRVLGWANASVTDGKLSVELGYVDGRTPRARGFRDALDAELTRFATFLGAKR